MREVDRRGKYSRRIVLQGAATAIPVVAVASSTGIGIEDAWAADATTLTPSTLKTLVKVARDIYPHDFLVDSYYITAIKPWDAKASKDPAVKVLLEDGVRRLDQDAQDRHKVAYVQVPWEADRVVLLQGIEQTDFFKKVRSDLRSRSASRPGRAGSAQGGLRSGAVGGRPGRPAAGNRADRFLQEGSLRSCCLALQPGRAVAEIRLRGLIRRARRIHQPRLQRHRLAAESLKASSKSGWEDTSWRNSI